MSIESPAEGNGLYALRGAQSVEALTEVHDRLEMNGIHVPDAGLDRVTKQYLVETQPEIKSEQRQQLATEIGYLLVRPRFAA